METYRHQNRWKWILQTSWTFLKQIFEIKPQENLNSDLQTKKSKKNLKNLYDYELLSAKAKQDQKRRKIWLVYLLLPGTREKLQGGFVDLFNLFFRQFSVYFRTKIRKKNPVKSFLKASIVGCPFTKYFCCPPISN